LGLTWLHVIIIALVGPFAGYSWELSFRALLSDDSVFHTLVESLPVAFFAILASLPGRSRTFLATAVGFGLMTASAIFVHLSGGYIELHFHFFVMLVFLALYQDWVPYLLSIAYVAIHHGFVGVLWPEQVYNHAAALNAPWTWAGIHAFFVLWSCVGSAIAWRFNERASAQTKLILDSAGEGIYGLDRAGTATFVNPAAARMLRLDASGALGRPMGELIRHAGSDGRAVPAGQSPILSPAAGAVAHQGSNEILYRADGTSFLADYHSTPMLERGELTGVVVTFSDVTDRKKAEENIQQNLKRIRALHEIDLAITSTLELRTTLDVLLERIDLFFDYSSASTVSLFNARSGVLEPVACRNLDETAWKTEKMKPQRSVAHAVFEGSKAVAISDIQSDSRIQNHAFFIQHGLRSYLGVPLVVRDKPLGVLGLYTSEKHDFSDQEVDFLTTLAGQAAVAIHNSQLHEETKKQAEALERSNRVKDQFLSVMSHELRTPLIAILGYTGLLEDTALGQLGPQQVKAARVIRGRANDLLAMIRTILEATKLEVGTILAEREEVDVRALLDDLAESYDTPLEKEVTLQWVYNGQLPDRILTDGGKLRQILQNLVSNAIKFTPEGNVVISARPIAQRRCIEFKVADTGIGIPEEMVPTIFEKFRQLDSSDTRLYEGVGLGLYIVRQFVELLGGSITVDSELGKGSTFTVIIPEQTDSAADRSCASL
jgi:PAS domain S-box-containing protein